MTRWALGPIVAGVLGLSACAATTVEPSATTAAPADTTTTVAFQANGATADLLAQFADELNGLSATIIDAEGDDDALGRLETLWTAIRAQLETERPELLAGFAAVMDLARSAVERRRPADADKARTNATALIVAATSS